ncbi:MAG TPA: hypothetical protein VHM93_03360 [Candidatus Acidoferrum sp.]|jgi:CheY-like chemotaxis protein|nr:hypothetical protein [Candidatus Acidoferrum sp.]
MNRVSEVIEVLPNSSRRMITVVSGLEFAKAAVEDLAKHTYDECLAVDAETHQIVMQLNVEPAKLQATKRVFQIADAEEPALRRTEVLKSRGYSVMAVMGDDAAKALLSSIQHYDLFIVGHSAPEETRTEMVNSLKARYPGVKILALNPPDQRVPTADYNVPQNGPENWLPIISQELANSASSCGA